MIPFSRRHKIREEFSGQDEASPYLRNRLMNTMSELTGDERNYGIGNDDYVGINALYSDLEMHFGEPISLRDLMDESKMTYDAVFDVVELYMRRAKIDQLSYEKKQHLEAQFKTAFDLSGSVYDFDGTEVVLRLDAQSSELLTTVNKILSPYDRARDIFLKASKGLIHRKVEPREVIKELYIALEEYIKKSTGGKDWNSAMKRLGASLHPIQIKALNNLKDYRGGAGRVAHSTDSDEPNVSDGLWYLRNTMSSIELVHDTLGETPEEA